MGEKEEKRAREKRTIGLVVLINVTVVSRPSLVSVLVLYSCRPREAGESGAVEVAFDSWRLASLRAASVGSAVADVGSGEAESGWETNGFERVKEGSAGGCGCDDWLVASLVEGGDGADGTLVVVVVAVSAAEGADEDGADGTVVVVETGTKPVKVPIV